MKKLVIRGDDIGYTHSFNIGAFQAIDEGIVTSADVMLESPGTEEALQMLKDRPWISIGWHAHLWESPVVGAENVPSMVDAEGRFKWRHSTDARQQKATVTYEDALKEFTAEMERCFAIVGRFPDTGALWSVESEYDQAMKDIMDRYGIAYNYMSGSVFGRNLIPDSKYAHLRYKNAPLINSKLEGLSRENMYDLANFKYYDPASVLMNYTWENDDEILMGGGHPGYLDDHILKESTCTVHRVKDVEAYTSPQVKQWIIDNKIELVNQHDVLYGTHQYQNYLEHIHSPLWIGNIK